MRVRCWVSFYDVHEIRTMGVKMEGRSRSLLGDFNIMLHSIAMNRSLLGGDKAGGQDA